MRNPSKRIERYREERIPGNDQISEADAEALLELSDTLYLLNSEVGDHRHIKLLQHLVMIAEEVGGLADALDDRDAAETIVRWINQHYDNESTNRDYRGAVRTFGKRLGDSDELPDSIEWIPAGTSSNHDPQPDPADMLRWEEDVVPMIEACHNNRDRAMIAVAWDAGLRSGEFKPLAVGDITDHKHGMKVTATGKRGQRSVVLIPSVPYLQRWLGDHNCRDDPDAPLWPKLRDHSSGISHNSFKNALTSAAERAGVDKPMTLTNFRKSSASHLASQGMNQAHLEEHHGWVRGSDVASRYVAIFGDEADRELARIHGVELDEADEPDPIGPVECPRCDRETPREQDFCVWCDQALDRQAVEELKLDERRVQRALLGMAKDNPDLLETAEEREEIMTALQDNPELLEQARRLVDETE